MISRIPLVRADQLSATGLEFFQRRGGLNVFRLLAGAPRVFDGWTRMVDAVLDSATFSARLRELVILRIAQLQRSRYELAQHADVARGMGVTDAEIAAVTDQVLAEAAAQGLDQLETTVLAFVTELCTTTTVSDETFTATQALLGTAALTELLLLISLYYGLALVLNAADPPVDETHRLQAAR